MRFEDVYVPLGFAWSTPFARWQGPLAEVNSLDMATDVTGRALADRGLEPAEITEWALGCTVPQKEGFFGGGVQVHVQTTFEVEGGTKPAVVAQMLLRYYA